MDPNDEIDMIKKLITSEGLSDWQRDNLLDVLKNHINDVYGPMQVPYEEPLKPKPKSPAQLRREHPSLQDAWEQYQLVLKLIRAGETVEEESEQ